MAALGEPFRACGTPTTRRQNAIFSHRQTVGTYAPPAPSEQSSMPTGAPQRVWLPEMLAGTYLDLISELIVGFQVFRALVKRGPVSSFGILRRGKGGLFRGLWEHLAVQTRLPVAFKGGQVYVTGRTGTR